MRLRKDELAAVCNYLLNELNRFDSGRASMLVEAATFEATERMLDAAGASDAAASGKRGGVAEEHQICPR